MEKIYIPVTMTVVDRKTVFESCSASLSVELNRRDARGYTAGNVTRLILKTTMHDGILDAAVNPIYDAMTGVEYIERDIETIAHDYFDQADVTVRLVLPTQEANKIIASFREIEEYVYI